MFIEYGKELENSNQIIKGYEDYVGDNKNKSDILDKVSGDNVKENCSEKDEVHRKNSINRFIKIFFISKCELQTNTKILWKKISIIVY